MEKYYKEYNDINIQNWAKQIREIKIRELEELVEYNQKELNKTTIFNLTYWRDCLRIDELKKKLKSIKI